MTIPGNINMNSEASDIEVLSNDCDSRSGVSQVPSSNASPVINDVGRRLSSRSDKLISFSNDSNIPFGTDLHSHFHSHYSPVQMDCLNKRLK